MAQELIVREEEAVAILTAPELKHRVNVIQQVMREVMKDGVHFGTIPGTPKPSLWQPGADILKLTFGISVRVEPVEERVTDEEVFYRVRATATAANGRELGSLQANCSTREKKFRWRAPTYIKEWEATPEHMRRITWDREGNEKAQVRTDPGDLIHTILMMAQKRADVGITKKVTGCADMFAQVEEGEEEAEEPAPVQQPQRASETKGSDPAQAVKIVTTKRIKSGEKDDGTPWTMHSIKTADGKEYITFDTGVFVGAQKAALEGYPVRLTIVPGKEGKSAIVEELVPVR